ncbi:MAG: DUF488 domain-containing protein [Acidobacteriota bacterium]
MIYTTGYTGKQPDDLKSLVKRLDVVLVDIRFLPRSRWQPHWNKSALQQMLGGRYVHVRELGNKQFRQNAINIADLERGIAIIETLALQRPVILMCACADYQHCHRHVVAEELGIRGREVEELESWAAS